MNATFAQQDDFNRRPLAEKISRLLQQSDIDVSPMIIDGAWGTGKSIFCQKLINLMRETSPDTHHLVYIDAFRTDHTGEPLLALLAEIIKVCVPVNHDDTEAQKERKNWINKFAAGAKFTSKTALKAVLGHLLKQDIEQLSDEWETALDDAAKEVGEKAIDAGVDKSIELVTATLLQEQIESEKNLQALQQTLQELASTKPIKPIILFIDELDRCRPDYAIDMLEIIKHVFDIPEVKIVLVTNLAQLRAAVNHRYGDIVDSHKYLDKFIRLVYTLPKKSLPNDPSVSIQYFWGKVEKSDNLKRAFSQDGYCSKLVGTVLDSNAVSLREVETIIRNLEIYFYLQGGTEFNSDQKIIVLTTILLYCLKPSLLQDLLNWRADANELARFIKGGTDIKKFFPIDDITYIPTYEDLDLMVFYILLSLCRENIENYDEHSVDVMPEKTMSEQCIESFMTPNQRQSRSGHPADLLKNDMEKILTVI